MKRYFYLPEDLNEIGKLHISYKLEMYRLPQFLGWILILDKNQYQKYYSFINKSLPMDYENYLQRLVVFFPVVRLIERGLINPSYIDFYNEIHNEFSFLNFDKNKVDITFNVDPDKVFKRYIEMEKPMKIWDPRRKIEDAVNYIGSLNEDVVDSDFFSPNIENYFFD